MAMTTTEGEYRTVRWGLLGGLALCLVVIGYSLVRYPSILMPLAASAIFLGMMAVAVVVYGVAAVRGTRPRAAAPALALRAGIGWGILVGMLWIVEVVAGNVLDTRQPGVQVLYYGAEGAAYGLPLVAGIWAARHTGQGTTGAQIGFWSGLVSGLITFLALMLVIYIGLALHLSTLIDPNELQSLPKAGVPDAATYVVGDGLAGATSHLLLIGPGLGTLAGAIGGFIGVQLRP